jgi:hypothetical protein
MRSREDVEPVEESNGEGVGAAAAEHAELHRTTALVRGTGR